MQLGQSTAKVVLAKYDDDLELQPDRVEASGCATRRLAVERPMTLDVTGLLWWSSPPLVPSGMQLALMRANEASATIWARPSGQQAGTSACRGS